MNYFNRSKHSFDWHGFRFSLKLIVFCVVAGAAAHFGVLYAQSTFSTSADVVQSPVSVHKSFIPPPASFSTSTPQRIIRSLTIADTIPKEGKFIVADLVNMKLSLYQDRMTIAEYPIVSKGRPGTPWETPAGFYTIQTKEEKHFSSIGKVYMPYSMQFYGNYFIHGRTYYPDGTLTSATFSGGCIKLDTENAQKVFDFTDVGTKIFVYDSKQTEPPAPLVVDSATAPQISASTYLIADMDTGDVYAERGAQEQRPIASVTKLMTALVANETISLDKHVSIEEGELANPQNTASTTQKTFLVNDLFYPLLMQSSDAIADSLAAYYGTRGFMQWMNTTARALDMTSTTYADASGISADNVSTPDDLYRLVVYLTNKKSFVLKITRTQTKTISASDGSKYQITNVNTPANADPFEGGKIGHTTAARDTLVSVLSFKVAGDTRHVAVVVLGSPDQAQDARHLADWITSSAKRAAPQTGCVLCVQPPQYRKIQL